jgi:hypothetical protein
MPDSRWATIVTIISNSLNENDITAETCIVKFLRAVKVYRRQ